MSDAREFRITAQWRDDPTEARMTVDLRIFEVRCASSWDVFGAFDLDGANVRPFILRREGHIDFGAGTERWLTDLRDAELRVGGEFAVWFNDADRGVYRIIKIAALGAKQDT